VRTSTIGAFTALAGAALVVFVADRVTKAYIVRTVVPQEGDTIPLAGGIVSITHVHNTGVAFGLFTNKNLLFALLALLVLAIIINFYRYLPGDLLWLRISLGLQIGGAVGNLLDRATQGFVTDFIDFHFWPVFNVADSSVCIGVVMLAIYLLLQGGTTRAAREGESSGPARIGNHPRVSDR
jgi:signal peptidase II